MDPRERGGTHHEVSESQFTAHTSGLFVVSHEAVCVRAFPVEWFGANRKSIFSFYHFYLFIETRLLIASLIKKSRSFSVYNFQRSLLKVYNIASLRHSYHLWTSTFISSVDFRHSYNLWISDIRIICGLQTFISSVDIRHPYHLWISDIHIICGHQTSVSSADFRHSYHL